MIKITEEISWNPDDGRLYSEFGSTLLSSPWAITLVEDIAPDGIILPLTSGGYIYAGDFKDGKEPFRVEL